MLEKSLAIRNISYTYITNKKENTGVDAVKDVSLDVKEGDIIALLGPSGCGKTTLLKCITGLLDVTSGKVIINEEDITNIQTRDRDIAYVFQKPFLYPHMSIYHNVCAALSFYGLTRDEIDHYTKEYLRKYKMNKYINFKPRHLSMGEQQKVCLIRAFIRKPALLLMDEPFANIDVKYKEELMKIALQEIKDKRIPTLMVTHDIEEAFRYATKIVLMEDGKIIEQGEKFDLLENPKTPLMKEYIKTYIETSGSLKEHIKN